MDNGKTVLQQSETHYSILKLLTFEFTNQCNACQIAVMPVLSLRPTVHLLLGQKLALQHSITATISLPENNGS
jgi:hypothetical protein